MVKFFQAIPALLLATFAAAANLAITMPSASSWWVAQSTNVFAWTCQNTTFSDFTVLINNTNPQVLLGPLAFIAIQQNFDCSVTVSQDQVDQPASTGYTLILANPLNETDIYAISDVFEIKPLGSLYPSQVSSSASVASGTGSATSASSTSTSTSKTSGGALSVHNPNLFGLVGIMGLLAIGTL